MVSPVPTPWRNTSARPAPYHDGWRRSRTTPSSSGAVTRLAYPYAVTSVFWSEQPGSSGRQKRRCPVNQYATRSPSGATRASYGPPETTQSPPIASNGIPIAAPSGRSRTNERPRSATIVPSSAIEGEEKPPPAVSGRSVEPSGVEIQTLPPRTNRIESAAAGEAATRKTASSARQSLTRASLERLADDGALAAPRLVEPADRRRVRRVAGDLRVLGALAQDVGDRVGERVERLLRLRLGRLDEQRLVDEQREVDRRRVEAVVEQALGEIERLQAEVLLHRRAREHELVHSDAVVGGREVIGHALLLEPREQVVRVQHRRLRRLLEAVAAERQDVRIAAHEDAVVALEAAQAPDRLRPVVVEVEARAVAVAVLAADDLRAHQVGLDAVRDRDRARARTAAAVRLCEGLVQVVVDDVEAHVARARTPHDGVEVRAVVVERRADLVDDLRDLGDVLVEQPERVRVREHQARDVLVGLRPQVLDVDAAALVGADLDDLVAGHRHRGRVGAVGGVRREDLGAVLAPVLVIGAGQQDAGELAVRAGARLE